MVPYAETEADEICTGPRASDAGDVVLDPLAKKLAPAVTASSPTLALALIVPAPVDAPRDDTVTTAVPSDAVNTDPAAGSILTNSTGCSTENWTISLATRAPSRVRTACARTGCPVAIVEVEAPAASVSLSVSTTLDFVDPLPPPPLPAGVEPPNGGSDAGSLSPPQAATRAAAVSTAAACAARRASAAQPEE